MSRPRITLCAIVRDEEVMLPDCLASARRAVDRMIVVDTGSSDRSIEIARRMGARVVEHEWQDDFAAARNAALEHVKNGFVLILDADERLAAGAAEALRRAVRRGGFDVGLLPLHHADGADASITDVVKGRRRLGDPVLLPRLLRRTPELRWEGVVHENVASWARGRTVRTLGARIAHYGAFAEVRQALGKDARNLRLLERRVVQEPDDASAPAYLARELQRAGRNDEAVEVSSKAWNNLLAARERGDTASDFVLPTTVHAHLLLEAGKHDEMVAVLDRAARENFDHPNLTFLAGVASEQRALRSDDAPERLDEAAARYQRCLETAEAKITGEPIPGSRGWQAWTRLGTVRLRQGRGEAALKAFDAALAERPGESEAELGRAEAMLLLGRSADALRLLEPWVERDQLDAWLLLAVAALALGQREDAVLFGERAVAGSERQKLLAPHRDALLRDLALGLDSGASAAAAVPVSAPTAPVPAEAARPRAALAWPRYGRESEVDLLLDEYGQALAANAVRLLLVHDGSDDGDLEAAIREVERAYARVLPSGTPLEVEIFDDPLSAGRLALLRESIDTVIDLPGSQRGARRKLLDAIGAPVMRSAAP